ncbi:tetratricopeptide repeat protein [Methanosarcina sp. Z-7115]|uniref:Tetratricopeptide repeat protein n=1 Tax=Methanosarcina baikalica TaxID=3073890 RepID=A0ABU2D3A5_9EURY|nr:tetratricopeptide repeat protein [Methanosarcina sp. Z-7115]MDR7666449.1 tetratricopeptide repeat protein [Methanosarcina sp. Z-7115]
MEIEETLPYFWAQDLNNYLKKYSKSAVLFIDTYEALWEKDRGQGNFNARDEWIRELISNLPESSLWVICGREELRWNEVDRDWNNYLEQYKLEKLPEEDALDFLNRCGIKEEEIQKVILKGSEGVPYYLELAVDTYIEIAKTGSPVPDNFARTRSEIFDRFMVYLSIPEQETLKVLSTPRFWNKDIFKALIEEFKTGYPLTAFSELNRFSFVQETEGKLLLHPLMRESLQTYQDHELKNEVHSFICAYYSNQLNSIDIKAITSEHETALIEAFYHAKESLEAEDLLNWFIPASDPFNRAALWQLITPLYEEMLQILEAELGPQHPDVATNLRNLADTYHKIGRLNESLQLYERSLDIIEYKLGTAHPYFNITIANLIGLYDSMLEEMMFYGYLRSQREKRYPLQIVGKK